MKRLAFGLILLLLYGGGSVVLAQGGSSGGDMLLSVFEHDDYGAAVAYNSQAQEFLVVWSHQGNIYGQRYNVQGVPQGENFVISNAPNGKYNPAVAYSLSTDSYLVAWEDHRGQDYDIYGQFVDADGGLLDNPTTPEDETDPAVNFAIYTGAGNQQSADLDFDGDEYLVVWQGNYQDDSVDVLGRFVDDNGTVEPTIFPIGTADTLPYGDPTVAYNATEGEYLVVYRYGDGNDAQIRARRVGPSGTLPGNEYPIAAQPDAADPDVAAAAWGAYVVVWSDGRAGGQGDDIYGQVVRSGADNSFDGGNFVIASAFRDQLEPAIALTPSSGQFLVVWRDGRGDATSDWDLYGQRLLADANLEGPNFVISGAEGRQYVPTIAASQSPEIYFVAWEDTRSGAYDLYGQRVAWTGSLLWYEFGISAQPESQVMPSVAYNPDDDQYLAVWKDGRGGPADVYFQRISGTGQPLEEAWSFGDGNSDEKRSPAVAYNSSQQFYLVVWKSVDMNSIAWCHVYSAGNVTFCAYYPNTENAYHLRLVYDEIDDTFLLVWEANGDIYALGLDWYGFGLVGPTLVAGGAGQQKNPALAFDSARQRYLVVWDDDQSGAERIYGRLMYPDGAICSGDFPVTDDSDGLPRDRAAVTYNPDADKFLVVYERHTASQKADICGEQVSPLGGYDPDEIVIRDQPTDADHNRPDIVYVSEADRYYVIWAEYQDATYERDLYCRWLESDGSLATGALPFFRYPAEQTDPRVVYDPGHEQGLVVWSDYRRGKKGDVYARLGAVDTTPPTASFTRDPTVGPAGTTFTFDAGASSDDLTPSGALAVRWDLNSDGNWETDWSYDKVLTKTVILPNTYTVTLEVRDLMGLTDTLSLSITVQAGGANTPPTATLTISPMVGLAGSKFRFDASASSDAETSSANLQVRWDWQNDGQFDTDWGVLKVRTPAYTKAGLHTARVEVRDEEGLTDAAVRAFLVLPGDVVTLTVSPGAATLVPGEAIQFRATAWDAYGNQMNNPAVTWSLTDPQAGTLGAGGVFTASTQAGEYAAVIRAESGSASDTASVTIVYPYGVYLPLVLRNP